MNIACKQCLYQANHPLGITFDDQGICSGCRVHREKDELDWTKRWYLLRSLVHSFKNRRSQNYDCVVPVTGGRDSFFILDVVRHRLGLNPLLVTYNTHYHTRAGLENLILLRTYYNCDILTQTLNPLLVRRLTRASIALRGSIYWHALVGQTVFAVRTAVSRRIPLIVFGVHQGCDQVGMYSHLNEVELSRRYWREHDALNLEVEDVVGNGISDRDIAPLRYPHDREIAAVGVRGIFLSNYIRWDSMEQHRLMQSKLRYAVNRAPRSFDPYNHVDSLHYLDLHDEIKLRKWGYGKATDHACREIRLGRMTRDEGLALAAAGERGLSRSADMFLSWIGMSRAELFAEVDRHRSPHAWQPASEIAAAMGLSVETSSDSDPASPGQSGLPIGQLLPRGMCSPDVLPR